MPNITGGCSCGKVRFSANAEPSFVGACHCRACQKRSGSPFAVIVALPASALTITGEVTTFDSVGDSGKGVHYRFCPNCGSPVASNVDVFADTMMIRSGSLDDPSWVKPSMEIYCEDKQPWISLGDGVASYAKMPG